MVSTNEELDNEEVAEAPTISSGRSVIPTACNITCMAAVMSPASLIH